MKIRFQAIHANAIKELINYWRATNRRQNAIAKKFEQTLEEIDGLLDVGLEQDGIRTRLRSARPGDSNANCDSGR